MVIGSDRRALVPFSVPQRRRTTCCGRRRPLQCVVSRCRRCAGRGCEAARPPAARPGRRTGGVSRRDRQRGKRQVSRSDALRGEAAGPWPAASEQAECKGRRAVARLAVRPAMPGPAAVCGRGENLMPRASKKMGARGPAGFAMARVSLERPLVRRPVEARVGSRGLPSARDGTDRDRRRR